MGAAGADERSPDLTALFQALVDRPGWAPGNAAAVVISGSGRRVAYSWDTDPARAVRLELTYQEPGTTLAVQACMPAWLNPNLFDNPVPTDAQLVTDCQARVGDSIAGLSLACGLRRPVQLRARPRHPPAGGRVQ